MSDDERLMYIGGPIFGVLPARRAANFARGEAAAIRLGYKPLRADLIKPFLHSGLCPPGRIGMDAEHSEECHLKADLIELLHCNAACFTAGWPASCGSKLEIQIASAAGIPLLLETKEGFRWTL